MLPRITSSSAGIVMNINITSCLHLAHSFSFISSHAILIESEWENAHPTGTLLKWNSGYDQDAAEFWRQFWRWRCQQAAWHWWLCCWWLKWCRMILKLDLYCLIHSSWMIEVITGCQFWCSGVGRLPTNWQSSQFTSQSLFQLFSSWSLCSDWKNNTADTSGWNSE